MNFPDLPLIAWDTFISRVRIRWTSGATPESFFNPDGKQHDMKDKKVAKPVKAAAKKVGKGSEKAGKKGCK